MSNLEWCTQSENVKHAFATGLKVPANLKGEDCPWSKLTADDIRYIRKKYIARDREFGGSALARKFGVCQEMISKIVLNKRWQTVIEEEEEMTNLQEQQKKNKQPFLYPHQKENSL